MKHSLFVVFTIIVISLTSSSCPTHPVYMDARLDGPLNIVPDSFYMERSKEYRFASVNFNFGDEMSVKLEKKLLRTIANRKMLGKDREFCLSLHPQLSIALQRLSGIIIL